MKRRNQGFTLVELLVVIAIIAILMILGGTNYTAQIQRSRDARRRSDLEQVRAALEMYRSENSGYPATPATWTDLGTTLNGFISTFPVDPKGNSYEYHQITAQQYQLCANLETDNPGGCSLGAGNFGITFP